MTEQILLADDEMTFRENFSAVLREEGYTVRDVPNGT